MAATAAFVWAGGPGDAAAILRAGGDERQRGLDRDATAITGLAMCAAAIAGVVIQTARGAGAGAYGLMCVVAGVAYTFSLVVLRQRR